SGGGGGDQINNCTSVSLVNVLGGPHLTCVNERTSGRAHGGGRQVNDCQVDAALGNVGDLRILPTRFEGPSVTCVNIRR
ncbi:hypothetical protein, partial [Streptomyces palmae]